MKSIACKLWLPIFLLTATLCPVVAAQENPPKAQEKPAVDPKTTTRVTLGSSSGTPGNTVVVPIYFTPAEGVQVGRLKLEVTFVSANMKFDKVERGIAAEMDDVNLTSDLKTSKNDKGVETSAVTVQASFPQPPKKGMSAGLLGYMTFKISEAGRPAMITLRAAAEGEDLGSKPLSNLRAFEAQVEVLAPGTQPAVACFFFTH